MNTVTRYSPVLIGLSTVLAALTACDKKDAAPQGRPPVAVVLATAVTTNTPILIPAYGTVQDRENVDIVPQVSGQITEILVKEGAVVTNGQALFVIDPRDYALRVTQAEGMVSADTANLEMARATEERSRPLLDKHLISPDSFDTLKTRVAALDAQLRIDRAALDLARLNLSRCVVQSPLNGLCSKHYVDAGNLAVAGATRLTNIRSTHPLRLECSVSEQYLPRIRAALAGGPMPVSLLPRGDTVSYPGTLSFIDNTVNTAAGTILLRGEVPNPEMKLWVNQFVDVRITAGVEQDAVMVPESAVQYGKGGPYLYAVGPDQKAAMRMVKTGIRDHDWIQITEGVKASETVVRLGQLMLYPGASVVDPTRAAPAPGKP